MAAKLHFLDQRRLIDSNGIADGSSVYFYLTGTSTVAPIFSDNALSVPMANPVVVGSGAAVPNIYLDDSITYRRLIVYTDGTSDDTDPYTGGIIPGEDFSGVGGASLIGTSDGGTVQDVLDLLDTDEDKIGIGVGASPLSSKFTIQTSTSFTGNAQHIYHYAQQTDPANQTSAQALHNYTDGVSQIIDTVGSGVSLRLKQARNASARPDKASTYVGDGDFWEILRARVSGAGNTGAGSDVLAKLDKQGLLRFYGSNGTDWDGTDTLAPLQFGSYTGFFTKSGFLGWEHANERLVIGAIETGVVYKTIHFACSDITILGDGTVPIATETNSLSTVYSYRLNTKPVLTASLPSAASAGAGARAFVTDATSAVFNDVLAGGGSNYLPVFSDGTNWRIG